MARTIASTPSSTGNKAIIDAAVKAAIKAVKSGKASKIKTSKTKGVGEKGGKTSKATKAVKTADDAKIALLTAENATLQKQLDDTVARIAALKTSLAKRFKVMQEGVKERIDKGESKSGIMDYMKAGFGTALGVIAAIVVAEVVVDGIKDIVDDGNDGDDRDDGNDSNEGGDDGDNGNDGDDGDDGGDDGDSWFGGAGSSSLSPRRRPAHARSALAAKRHQTVKKTPNRLRAARRPPPRA